MCFCFLQNCIFVQLLWQTFQVSNPFRTPRQIKKNIIVTLSTINARFQMRSQQELCSIYDATQSKATSSNKYTMLQFHMINMVFSLCICHLSFQTFLCVYCWSVVVMIALLQPQFLFFQQRKIGMVKTPLKTRRTASLTRTWKSNNLPFEKTSRVGRTHCVYHHYY